MKETGRFYLPEDESPAYYNLSKNLQASGWQKCQSRGLADFSDTNFQFDEQAAQCLEYKHLLAGLVQTYCPEIMPATYVTNDHNWPDVVNKLADDRWILKPSLLNNGQYIKIFQTLNDIKAHFLKSDRMGGEHVIQHYINNPHLLRDDRKYSIRMFLVITNFSGAFLYKQGYFNVAKYPFSATDFNDLKPHLTNEHLFATETNVIQIPSIKFEFFPVIYPQIAGVIKTLMSALQQLFPTAFMSQGKQAIALFGMDFMLDDAGKIWLLEANHGPCFPVDADHPLQSWLYDGFWAALIQNFVKPIAGNYKQPGESANFEQVL